MKARFFLLWLLGGPSFALPITYYEPGYGNAGPLVLAHLEYAWINEHGYKGTDGLHCCGWQDCKEIDASEAKPTPDGQGYSTPNGIVGNKGVYHSRDGKAWICRFQNGPPKCLFIPGGG
jgi:hypothetical protein